MVLLVVICVTLFTAIFQLFIKWANKHHEYFAERKIRHVMPRFLVGNTFGLFAKKYRAHEFMQGLYNRFPNEKCVLFCF